MPDNGTLGATLKKLRKDRGLTLLDVTAASGIPRSTLSKIENDQTSPTFDNLTRLSACLNVDIVQLFSEISSKQASRRGGRLSVNKRDSGDVIRSNGQILHYLSTNLLDKKFTPIMAEISARNLREFGPLMSHPGDEFLCVLEGELEFHTDTYAPVILKAGESVYFDGGMGHAYIARGNKPCRTISVCTMARNVPDEPVAETDPDEKRRIKPTPTGKRVRARTQERRDH